VVTRRWFAAISVGVSLALSPACTPAQLADARTAADTVGAGLAAVRALIDAWELATAKGCACPPVVTP